MDRMVTDIPNLFWRVAAAHNGKYTGDAEDKAGLALHSSLITLNKYYKAIQPEQLAVVFEGSRNWRKTYTSSERCVSKLAYKGNRIKDPAMEHLITVLNHFEDLVRNHTSIVCLQHDELEGDDLIAGYCQMFPDDKITILSGDKDFTQLLKNPNVTLLNPDKGVPRTCDDPEFFMFEKCIRGDVGDNVRSAYPNVRKTRLEKAFNDPYEFTQLMNETWTKFNPKIDEEETFVVKDLFEENRILMDLECQPLHIRTKIAKTIEDAVANHGNFNLFQFNRFLGKHDLKSIATNPDTFVKMFSCTQVNKPRGIIEF